MKELLLEFYETWIKAESNRGCYSCCPNHDSRCEADRGIGPCNCHRDKLEELSKEIDNLLEIKDGK